MAKLHCVTDEDIEKDFPRKWAAKAEIETVDGRRLKSTVEYPKGDPENPLSWDEIIWKFRNLAAPVFDDSKCSDIVAAVRDLEKVENITEFMQDLSR